jgi:hypothetical protein
MGRQQEEGKINIRYKRKNIFRMKQEIEKFIALYAQQTETMLEREQ